MIQQLYPLPAAAEKPLQGSYLDLKLHQQAKDGDVLIYANYISSLDGRISLLDEETGEFSVPQAIANGRDWRLYQELAGQSDVMLTSARYFRQLAQGKAQDLLPVGASPEYADIQRWRAQQGLKAQPDVVILSDSLDLPLSALHRFQDRKIIVLTTNKANKEALAALEQAGVQVMCAVGAVTGAWVRQTLIDLHYRSAYMIAGPAVHHTLLADGSLDELFLTSYLALLGGKDYHTVLEQALPAAVKMQLLSLCLDAQAGQMLMRYRVAC